MEMDKKRFCEIMDELHEGYRLQRKIANAVRQYNNITNNDFPEPRRIHHLGPCAVHAGKGDLP